MDDRVKKLLNGSFANLKERQKDGSNSFIALLALEGEPTSDGRYLAPGALQTRSLPIPLTWQFQTSEGHDGSVPVGKIEEIWRVEVTEDDGRTFHQVWGRGYYDTSDMAQEAKRLAAEQVQRGISIDAVATEWHTEVLGDDPENVLQVMDKSELMGATQVTHPAFRDAFIAMESKAITASAQVAHYAPAAWFENPKLKEVTPVQVQADGRVFGHIATWDSCHIGFSNICQTPPSSDSNYAYFNNNPIVTSDGKTVHTGVLTDGTFHPHQASWKSAQSYYDHTGYGRADVVAGEDEIGIWVAGAIRADQAPEDIYRMTASEWSGDWREVKSGQMELVGVLAVNCAGFPIARQGADGLRSLVAAGALRHEEQPEDDKQVDELVARVERLEAAERKRRLSNVMSKIQVRDKD